MPARVVARNGEGRSRYVGCSNVRLRDLTKEADRQAAASGPDVRQPGRGQLCGCERGERLLDDELALGTGNQDVRCDAEVESPEFTSPDDVGRRFAVSATTKPLGE